MSKSFYQTKKGGASIFVVTITILIFSIITVGFMRFMFSNTLQTTNDISG